MTITIKIDSVYGRERIRITSSHARQINSLTGKTTISRDDIDRLKELGFKFVVEARDLLKMGLSFPR